MLGIRRKRIEITPLPLCIYSIESKRRLAAAAHARNHDKLAARYIHVDIFEVVRPCSSDADEVLFLLFHLQRKISPQFNDFFLILTDYLS